MRDIAFTTFQDVSKLASGRAIVLFGAGNIAAKTNRALSRKCSMIVDNNPNAWGTRELDVEVRNPDYLLSTDGLTSFLVICTTSYVEVADQLEHMGFSAEEDFIVSPLLNDLRIISEMESCKARLLFTSGVPEQDSPLYGGGIYELELDGDEWAHRKVHSGNCHGLIYCGENIISVDDKLGLIELDSNYRVIRAKQLPAGIRAHGIAFSDVTQSYYLAASYLDKTLIFDREFNQTGVISLSDKYEVEGDAQHHCNDVCIVGNSLYVSMFSYGGNWKRDVFDGVVLEIDLKSHRIRGPVITNLWMPHNVLFIGGSLTVLDSLRGQLKRNNAQIIGEFPGFARGLGHDGVYYYVGQSRNRNYSKYMGLSKNISLDTSIIVFDEHTKVSRSLSLPSRISEIHSIQML